jgi:diacylglycerol O-acyltransferase
VGVRLSAVDGSFLRLESASAHMHLGWSALLEPDPELGHPSIEALRGHVAARLPLAPRARQRLAFPTLGIAEPRWVDDPGFDVAEHVSAATGAREAVSTARFAELADAFLSRPLDRSRPLWEVLLVPRLADGRVGLVGKMHHAMVDGVAALELALLLFDLDEPTSDGRRWVAQAPPGGARLAAEALFETAAVPLRAAREARRFLVGPRERAAALAATVRRAALAAREDLLPAAPPCALNVAIGPQRTLIGHRAELALVQRARRPHGVTVNDVCLAAIAGALRTLALARDEPPRTLKAMVPVSVRADDERGAPGNRISLVFIELPVDAATPSERRARVRAQTCRFKDAGRPHGVAALFDAAGYLPIPLRAAVARAAASSRMYNLTISNVPGPSVPVTVLGARLAECYPVVPVADRHALSIGVLSYCDQIFFGLHADPHASPTSASCPRHSTTSSARSTAGRAGPAARA